MTIPIFVETREDKVLQLMVDPHQSVENVKRMVQERTGGPAGQYPVKAQVLADNASIIFKYGIVANSQEIDQEDEADDARQGKHPHHTTNVIAGG